jgi:uncharacterized protein YuzE
MDIEYFADTDTLFIRLANRTGNQGEDLAPNVVGYYDDAGHLVALEIDPVKDLVELSHLSAKGLPIHSIALDRAPVEAV